MPKIDVYILPRFIKNPHYYNTEILLYDKDFKTSVINVAQSLLF